MNIITVNLPVPFLKILDMLCGENRLYPSRSEAIRCAIKKYLAKEFASLDKFKETKAKMMAFPPKEFDVNPTEVQIEGRIYKVVKK
jgi:Arc/MetJ-type ribon-helix-helix transcriptional regulator